MSNKAPAKKAPIKKFNKDSNKGLRSILLIIIISVSTFLLVVPSPKESLADKNVTQYLLKPFFTTSRAFKCSYSVSTVFWKCNRIDIKKWASFHNVPNNELNFYLINRTKFLEAPLPLKVEDIKYGDLKKRAEGTFYLKKKYYTDYTIIGKIINILHPTLLIILIFYTWRLRFCITGVTISFFKKIKAAI